MQGSKNGTAPLAAWSMHACMHATTDQVHFSTIHRLTYLAVAMMLAGEVSSVCVSWTGAWLLNSSGQ